MPLSDTSPAAITTAKGASLMKHSFPKYPWQEIPQGGEVSAQELGCLGKLLP